MPRRIEYLLDLTQATPKPVSVGSEYRLKSVFIDDSEELADLMLDAYQGTIDYHGETIDDARDEIRGYFSGKSGGKELGSLSRVLLQHGRLVSACLSVKSDREAYPLIAYSMTRASEKGNRLAQYLLSSVLQQLKNAGYGGVTAVITEGNTRSERLFRGSGFKAISK